MVQFYAGNPNGKKQKETTGKENIQRNFLCFPTLLRFPWGGEFTQQKKRKKKFVE
jgi:hypothetical protein